MKLLVVGGGGREHAIIKKLKENKEIDIIIDKDIGLSAGFTSFGEFSTILTVTNNVDLDKFFEEIWNCFSQGTCIMLQIDLTDFAEINIPSKILDRVGWQFYIYVNKEVKNNYLEYEYIQIKE